MHLGSITRWLLIMPMFLSTGCALDGATAWKQASPDPGETAGLRAPTARVASAAPAFADSDRMPAADNAIPAAAVDTAAPATNPAEKRQVVYGATFKVVVANLRGSLEQVREMATEFGGYMQEEIGGTITVRVPAAKFEEAVEVIEGIGEVVSRQLRAQDVTDAMRDLRIHLDNDEKLRQRLQALLAKAEKVEDALKIEAELARVTESLDRTKGQLRVLESQVAMSDIRVELNTPVGQPANGTGPGLPFDSIEMIGDGLVAGQVQSTVRKAGVLGHGPRFKPPADFVRYYEASDHTEAMDAEGVRLRVIKWNNVDKAALPFWSKLVRKALVDGRSLSVKNEETGNDFYLVEGMRDVGGKPLGYLLSLKRSNGKVIAFEAWGPRDLVEQKNDALRTSALSIDPK